MGFPPTLSPDKHVYPQEIQLKLYQAFIFSIPILFSIILFLLFYLFYLKRKATSLSSPSQVLPTSFNHASTLHQRSVCQIGLDQRIKEKLPIVLLDEELRTRDSHCCVCLGEYEMKEELLQIPSCKHVFHIECIHHWLHSNTTCPLCRSSVVIPTLKLDHHQHQSATEPDIQTPIASSQQQREVVGIRERQVELAIEESSSSAEEASSMNSTSATDGCSEISISIRKETGSSTTQ